MKKLTRAGAGALAGVMIFGLAAPLAPLSVEAAGEIENLALNKTATASEQETDSYSAAKAVDGVVNRDAAKPQSRWATNTHSNQEAQWLKVDLGEKKTFRSFVLAWERRNITSYKIQISDTGEDNDDSKWTTVYEKKAGDKISGINENIRLDEQKEARYVRLYIDGYTADAVGDSVSWQSVSLYDFQIYADEIPDDVLPNENYCLEGTAEANDYEKTDGDTQAPSKAIDGNLTTRWATNPDNEGKGAADRTLTVTLPVTQRVQHFKINWEKTNIKEYTIEVKDSSTGEFKQVYENTKQITSLEEIISLDAPVWAKEIRLNVKSYGEAVPNWYNVSVAEFGAYAVKPEATPDPETPEDETLQALANSIAAPQFNADKTQLTWNTPEGVKVEFLADYEQIVGRDGKIYQPLTDTEIKGVYKVTKTAASATDKKEKNYAEATVEHTITIPGKHKEAGVNAKPTVVPELAEWYGGETEGNVTISGKIVVDPNAGDLKAAADALATDYEAELGKKMTVATGSNPAAGDIYFTLDKSDNGLGEEGYVMESDSYVKVTAAHQTGAYWATRSIIQIAELNEGKLPKGTTRDYPKYEVRGFMLDVARKPVSMETLEDVAKEMAYYKMNALHVHLNDNLIFYEDFATTEEAREKAYTGFRLESDIKKDGNGGKNKADLTNKDMHYTKEEFRKFILDCRAMGVDIIPEFDTPGHSGAFTKVRPDLMLQKTMEGNAKRAGEQFDLSDEKYADSLAFVQSVWDEYLNDDMFDDSMTLHIGTDEYYGEANCFRKFTDDMIKHLKKKGYKVRMWGSLTNKKENQPDAYPVDGEGVQLNIWSEGYANPQDMYSKGYELINTLEGNYIVPAAGYYNDYVNSQSVYQNWQPNKYSNVTLPAGSDQVLGGTFAIWNDSIDTRANGISEVDIYDRFVKALPAFASKNWGDGTDKNWSEVKAVSDQLGDAANSNPYHKATADESGKYMEYQFENEKDSSDNKRDLELAGGAKLEKGSLKLTGGESYATTPIDKLATGNTLEFDITLDKEAKAGEILFEADNLGDNGDYVHDIRIMEDGRLGFRRELYDYYFDYKLPVGEKVHLAIRTDGTKTSLIVDGQELQATGVYRNRQTDPEGKPRKEGISISTLLLPLQRIGSKTNSVKAVIDNVVVSTEVPETTKHDKSGWTGKATSAHANVGNEGTFEMAFDSKPETHWHSDYSGNKEDKLLKDNLNKVKGKLDSVTGEITFDKGYEINKVSFTPRTNAASGIITKADLFVKNSADGEWIPVAENQTFANNSSKKTVRFAPQTVWGIKIVAKQSNDGWVAVSEFDIAVPQKCDVVVEAQEGGKVEGAVKDANEGSEVTVKATAKKGYDFTGWYDMTTGQKVSDDAEYTFTVEMNTSLIAHFAKNGETPDPQLKEWTVTFKGSDGEIIAGVKVEDGKKVARPENDPVKEGYKFIGWFVDGKEFDFNTEIKGNLVIEARFEKNDTPTPQPGEWTVTINGQTVTVKDGETLARPADPVKEGYKFIGWFVDGKEFDFNTPITGDLKIEARFEKLPTPEPNPDKNDKNDKNDKVEGAVQTGDTANAVPWIVCLGAAAGVGVVVLKSRKKRS
ncbi:discoidin domain-containing protein [[Ruminococcus] torques]|uniref:discoidin domain-containing protein n=1 Tax=[Ruminococcus] torques TaxID=33039 RepID=UPI0027B917BD|nr:discoidin domain-containing protein [[Ruminococcus] torques]